MFSKFSLIILFCISGLYAQLSPGDLHTTHKDLEGLENCLQCHSQNKETEISPEKCLKCHKILKERIDSGKGLHSREDYKDCKTCHIEHQGRNADLIFWRDGKDQFDHDKTGYLLKGKHATLKCEKCHNSTNISNKALLIKAGKNLNRTFLGLKTRCTSCHEDEHRGQLDQRCETCHNTESWKNPSKFDHNKSRYPLTGKHTTVKCIQCHVMETDNKFVDHPRFQRFKPLNFEQCSSCHEDIHKGKLGPNCNNCHITTGWKENKQKVFDHTKTRFPLIGRHQTVACEKCHLPGKPITAVKFGQCSDCHEDYHFGKLKKHPQWQKCAVCHIEKGFSPSTFTISDHDTTKYPLKGGHLAIPCIACHKQTVLENRKTIDLSFKSTTCLFCHGDPHKTFVNKWMKTNGCQDCHSVTSWESIPTFDHSRTSYPLTGEHVSVQCGKCHVSNDNEKYGDIQFTGLKTACVSCHKDVHEGQFIDKENPAQAVNCQRCHKTDGWKKLLFNHNTMSRYPLKGKHRDVQCQSCHPIENGVQKFKPLGIQCRDCHGKNIKRLE